MVDLTHGGSLLLKTGAQRRQGNVEADLVAVLEAIRDGFRRMVDLDGHALDQVGLAAGGKRCAGKAMDPERHRVKLRPAVSSAALIRAF